MKKPKALRKRDNEAPEDFTERRKQYKADMKAWESSVPMEQWTLRAVEERCKELGLVCHGRKKDDLIRYIRQAESGEFVAASRSKKISMEPKAMVTVQFPEPVLGLDYVLGNNVLVEHIPKHVWSLHIFPHLAELPEQVIEYLFEIRQWCKYFYVICTPLMTQLAKKYFGVLDLKLWCMYRDAMRQSFHSDLNRFLQHYGRYATPYVKLVCAVAECGSAAGIASKMAWNKTAEDARKVITQEKEAEKKARYAFINEALARIGCECNIESLIHLEHYLWKDDVLEILEFMRDVLKKRNAASIYMLKRYAVAGSYEKIVRDALTTYFQPDVLVFAKMFQKCRWTFMDFGNTDSATWVLLENNNQVLGAAFNVLFQRYQETGVMPDFENEAFIAKRIKNK